MLLHSFGNLKGKTSKLIFHRSNFKIVLGKIIILSDYFFLFYRTFISLIVSHGYKALAILY